MAAASPRPRPRPRSPPSSSTSARPTSPSRRITTRRSAPRTRSCRCTSIQRRGTPSTATSAARTTRPARRSRARGPWSAWPSTSSIMREILRVQQPAAPFDVYRNRVRPEWIDHNGHMNMGYYVVVFDLATDEFFRSIGLDEAHRRASRVTTFALEAHVTYHREVREGDPLRFTTLLLGHDAKRLHYFHQMYHAEAAYPVVTQHLTAL